MIVYTICYTDLWGDLNMVDYKSMYFKLFAAAADAVDALEQNRPLRAREILIQAQSEAEERYLSEEDE